MDDIFELLANIQPVAPEKDLWQGILHKKDAVQKVPFSYLSAAAACLVLLVSIEIFFIQNHKKMMAKADLHSLVFTPNTTLNYE
jgi:hypothetical protein